MIRLFPRRFVAAFLLGPLTLSLAGAQQFTHSPGLIPGPANWTEGVACVDVDADGDLDLCFAEGEGFAGAGPARQNVLLVNQLVETGSLAFLDESVARLGQNLSNAKDVIAGDVDGDGWVDLLYLNAFNIDTPFLYINRGAAKPGFFTLESSTRGLTDIINSASAQFGDLDDDGDLDVIFNDSGPSFLSGPGGKPRLYFNDGAGNFTEDAVALDGRTMIGAMDVQLVDFDDDWDLDFLGINRGGGGAVSHYLMLNDGTGTFTDASNLLPTTSMAYEAEVSDLDLDGDSDIFFLSLTGFQEGPMQNLLVENGALGFVAGTPLPGAVDDNEVVLIDYDLDGDLDVMIGSLGSRERLYRNDGGLSFVAVNGRIEAIADSTLDAGVGDLDNDGDYDLITAQGESNQAQWINKVYLNGGGADVTPPRILEVDGPIQPLDWPALLHLKVSDETRDDGVSHLEASALVAPGTGVSMNMDLTGNAFVPAQVQITSGSSVIFNNISGAPLTLESTTDPYGYTYNLAASQSAERIYVAPGSYDVVTGGGMAVGRVDVVGTAIPVPGTHSGDGIFRFAVNQLPPSAAGVFGIELFVEDWPGNVVEIDTVIFYPGEIGTNYCGPAVPNSSGQPATIAAEGSPFLNDDLFRLTGDSLPRNVFGYFLTSLTQAFVVTPPGSQGTLCLGGQIGRFAKQVQNSGAAGQITLDIEPSNMPLGAVLPGETWNFQLWFRDQNPGLTSNFTDGVSVTFF